MKNVLRSLAISAIVLATLAACTDENIRPRDNVSTDKCQFSGKGCN